MSGLLDGRIRVRIAPGGEPADESTWLFEDVTSFVRFEPRIKIDVGQRNEGSTTETAMCSLTVDNTDGRFTPKNPTGQWYGLLRRNTPIDVAVFDDGEWHTRFVGLIPQWPPRWNPAGKADAFVPITAKGELYRLGQGASQLDSPLFRALSTHPNAVAYWSCEDNDGSTSAASPIAGVAPWPITGEFAAIDGPPGSDRLVTVAADTSSTVARVPNHTPGDVYVAQVAWRIDEALTAGRTMLNVFTTSPDLAHWRLIVSSTQFTVRAFDDGGGTVVDSSETIHPDLVGQWVRVELRLVGSGGSVVWSGAVYAIDPAETQLNSVDGVEASSSMGRITRAGIGSGNEWGQARSFGQLSVLTGTTAELGGSFDETADLLNPPFHGFTAELAADRFERLCDEEGISCSVIAPTGGLLESTGVGADNASAPDAAALDITGDIDLRAWVQANDWAVGETRRIVEKWETSGDQRSYMLRLSGSGQIELVWSTDGTSAGASNINSGVITPLPPDDAPLAIRATLDVDDGAAGHVLSFYTGPSLDGPWTLISEQTFAGTTSIHAGTADLIIGDTLNGTAIGIIRAARVYDGIGGTLVASPDFTAQQVGATSFDDAQGNTWTINGDAEIVRAGDSMPMGPQQIDTLVANLRDVEATDRGVLSDGAGGLTYRTRTHLYNQAVALAIPDGGLSATPHPTDDDQQLRNDVTAASPAGTFARAVDATSVKDVGRYNTGLPVNPATADQLLQAAHWALHLGTVDEMRWPKLSFAFHREDAPPIADWLAMRLGDRVTAVHNFEQLDGVDIDQLAVGWTELIDQFRWDVTLNCVPASTHDVAVFDTSRFDTAGSETSGSFDAGTDTSLTVVTTATRPWVNTSDHASEFPFEIEVAGVVLNVTAISGSTSPQTFTVDQAPVNGVSKTIPSGEPVRLAARPVFAL